MTTNKIIYLPAKQSNPRLQAKLRSDEKKKTLDEELIECTHALIDITFKQAAGQLKCMDLEDIQIVLKELEALMLRVKRATQLAKMCINNGKD